MQIDIYSDVICPWCYIGKRRLERALAERPQNGLTLQWRAFQLNPDMPAQGMDRQLYLQLKFGSAASAERIYREIKAVGQEEDLPFAFDAIRRTPNTIECHRLIRFAGLHGRQDAVVEALFGAYFLDGEDIGATEVLLSVAEGAGLDPAETQAFLDSDLEAEAVRAEDLEARRAGLQGVPTFIFNGKYALSGAHLPEVLHQMFDIGQRDDEAAGASHGAGKAGA
ncbi:MAG: DsbA family oxidoreductase [Kiloniellales bacterium]|nr:DsbA family oxidoreductase [Kiloniellales bacterium]